MSNPHDEIVGTWEAVGAFAFRVVLGADGSGDFNGTAGAWRLENGTLTIGNESATHTFAAAVDGDQLTLTAEFMPHPFLLQRVPGDQAGTPPTPAEREAAASLVGRWRGTQADIVLRADGTGEVADKAIRYTADDAAITIYTTEGPVRIRYAFAGDRLIIAMGGEQLVLMRVDGDAPAEDQDAAPAQGEYSKDDAVSIQASIEKLTPEELRMSAIAGILQHGRRFVSTMSQLADLLDNKGAVQEQFEQTRLLLAHWLLGTRLTERADEDELRVNELVSILNAGGDEYVALTRVAAQAVLALPHDHPQRDVVHVGEALLRHIDWCETNGQFDIEVLSISDIFNLTLERPGLVPEELAAKLIERGESRVEQVAEPWTRHRFHVALAGYYSGLAIQARDNEDAESLARLAAQAEAQLALIEANAEADDPAVRRSWLLVAGVQETSGRLREAADTYARLAPADDATADSSARLAAIAEGRLRVQLGDYERTVSVLTPRLAEYEREYLTALEDAEIESAGKALSNLVANLTFAHARLGQWDEALQTLDRSKNLRFRHRAALREHEAGRHLLRIERALYGVARGAVVVTEPSQSYLAADDRYANVSLRTHLLEEYRQMRPDVQSDLLESPSVRTIAGLLDADEAVAIIGIGYLGTLLCVILPGDDHSPSGHRVIEELTGKRLWGLAGETRGGWMRVLSAPEGYKDVTHREALLEVLPGLDEAVGRPIAEMLDGRAVSRLTIVAHEWLHQAPLWALPSLTGYCVVLAPSAANFVRSRRSQPPVQRTVLAVGDPTLDLPVSPAETGAIARHLSDAGWMVSVLGRQQATEAAITTAAAGASLLHFCGHGRSDQIRPTRSSLLVHPDPDLLAAWGADPFESAASQIEDWGSSPWDGRYAAVPGRGRLYEITYAEINARERFLEYSETGTMWGRYQDGQLVKLAELWRAGDLLVDDSLRGCRLAFLSACEVGGGGLSARDVDEGLGLAAALHLAGVSTLICSLWPVSDVFTALYVDLFYERLAHAGTRIDIADLVRRVGLEMRDMSGEQAVTRLKHLRTLSSDPRTRFRLEAASAAIARGDEYPYRHPADWAAFYVIGAPVLTIAEAN